MSVIPTHRAIILASARLARLADLVTEAKEHIAAEFVRTDGAAKNHRLSDGSRGSASVVVEDENGLPDAVPVSPVEATVVARQRLLAKMAEINDDTDAIIRIIASCERTCRAVKGTRVPIEANRCEADPSDLGYNEPLSEGGWHDPLCEHYARSNVRFSLCNACRMRQTRWRVKRGRKPESEGVPVEFDCEVRYNDGVAHAWPPRPKRETAA